MQSDGLADKIKISPYVKTLVIHKKKLCLILMIESKRVALGEMFTVYTYGCRMYE